MAVRARGWRHNTQKEERDTTRRKKGRVGMDVCSSYKTKTYTDKGPPLDSISAPPQTLRGSPPGWVELYRTKGMP